MTKITKKLVLFLLALLLFGLGVWGALAIYFAAPSNSNSATFAILFALTSLAILMDVLLAKSAGRWKFLAVYLVLFLGVFIWYQTIQPSNDRQWQPDVALLPYADIKGNLVTFHNIRNFDYRSETNFTPRYYNKTYDITQLKGIDLIASYWMEPGFAHVFLSFDFGTNNQLAVSIEARKEKGEDYSIFKGAFRQYELFYVVADERDVIRLRTNYRRESPETLYVYRVRGTAAHSQKLFMEYVKKINALITEPEFYNSLTTNCASNIWFHNRINPDNLAYSWKILVPGYVPKYLHEAGRLDSTLTYGQLQNRVRANARAKLADTSEDFSVRIRQDLAPSLP